MPNSPLRRSLAAGVIAAVLPTSVLAQTKDERVAIVDVAYDTRPYLQQLREAGVKVIGRYYGRCPQWNGKRLADQGSRQEPGSEVSKILESFGLLAIYQYYSNSRYKFEGKRGRDGKIILPDADCKEQKAPHTLEVEARLDAEAALDQARKVGQPKGTAVYFGVDFDYDAGDAQTQERIVRYFKTVGGIIKPAGYSLGVYGNGRTLTLLKGEAEFFWLSASRAYTGTTEFYNKDSWHLLQTWTDLQWFSSVVNGKCKGLPIDTNVQSAKKPEAYAGFWGAQGRYQVEAQRTLDIVASRRFACGGRAIIRSSAKADADPIELRTCVRAYTRCEPALGGQVVPQVCHGEVVRIGRLQDGHYEVDVNDDGFFDGWVDAAQLTKSFAQRPPYIRKDQDRANAVCR